MHVTSLIITTFSLYRSELCLNVRFGCITKVGEGASKGKKIFQIANATKFPAQRDLAIKWLHNIGPGYNVDRFNFNRKITSQSSH